jgi:hypothetical protein
VNAAKANESVTPGRSTLLLNEHRVLLRIIGLKAVGINCPHLAMRSENQNGLVARELREKSVEADSGQELKSGPALTALIPFSCTTWQMDT